MLILAACGGDAGGQATQIVATPRPTLTPTMRSTPLPTVASPVPLGVEDRPLKIALIGESSTATNRLLRDMTQYFTEETENFRLGLYNGLQVEFVLLESRQEAITLLCNSPDTAVFVDIFTYITAHRICGAIPTLQVEKDNQRGTNFELVVRTDFITSAMQLVRADNQRRLNQFCVTSTTDPELFVHPALALRAIGNSTETNRYNIRNILQKIDLFDPSTVEIRVFDDDAEMVEATQGGGNQRQCEALVLPVGRFDEIVEDRDEDARPLQAVAVFNAGELLTEADQWQPIPYDVLVFPPENLFPVYFRDELLRVFSVIAEDDEAQQRDLQRLIEHDALVPVTAEDFATFEAWLNKTGWNMGAPLTSQ